MRRGIWSGGAEVLAILTLIGNSAKADDPPRTGDDLTVSVVSSTVPANGDVNPYGGRESRTQKATFTRGTSW